MARELDEWLRNRAQKLHQVASSSTTPPTTTLQPTVKQHVAKSRRVHRNAKKLWLIGGAVVGLLVITTGFAWWRMQTKGFFSADIQKTVTFSLYYPDKEKLPDGYIVDTKHISASDQAVIFVVRYETNKQIVFTVQKKPDDNQLKLFYAQQLPLHNDISTAVGKAAVGSLNGQTLASLPTDQDSWILATAPKDTPMDQLYQVLKALQKQ